ncbi:hypothetical protein [Roseomonas sp. WA12]
MRISYHEDGRPYVARYEVGDFVQLRTDESGDGAMGKVGDWGSVLSVEGRMGSLLTIKLAGHSQRRESPLQRLAGIPVSIVVPCNARGEITPLPRQRDVRGLQVSASNTSSTGGNQHVTVSTGTALPPWAATLVVAGSTLLLVVAAVVAMKGFGVI